MDRGVARLLVATLLLLAAFAACDRSAQRIVGKWQVASDTRGVVWEFLPNGSVKAGTSAGRYSFGDRGRLKIQTQFATFVYEHKIAGDRMTWRDPNGATTELKRVP